MNAFDKIIGYFSIKRLVTSQNIDVLSVVAKGRVCIL